MEDMDCIALEDSHQEDESGTKGLTLDYSQTSPLHDKDTESSASNSNENNESEDEGYEYDGGELPLEVITTVEKLSHPPVLKVKSNGVLTHRNIFTDNERAVLKEIVVDYQDIVDTKSRSRETFLEKQQAWQSIVVEYNKRPGMPPRTVKELRKCWDNMKYRARQAEKEAQQQKSLHETLLQDQGCLSLGDIAEEGLGWLKNAGDTHSFQGFTLDANKNLIEKEMESIKGNDCPKQEDEVSVEPVMKKARQEAPKLSSLLLAANVWKCINNNGTLKTEPSSRNLSPEVSVKKEDLAKVPSDDLTVSYSNGSTVKSESIISLAKKLPPCVTVTEAIPDKGRTTFHLGSGMTITSQPVPDSRNNIDVTAENYASIRPMPSLKKMSSLKAKQEEASRKSKLKKRVNLGDEFSLDAVEDCENKELQNRLLQSRIEQERVEHKLKIKLLEKQLQAYTNQSNFWALKLKLLRNNQIENETPYCNGERFT